MGCGMGTGGDDMEGDWPDRWVMTGKVAGGEGNNSSAVGLFVWFRNWHL